MAILTMPDDTTSRSTTRPLRRLTVEGDPVTRMIVIRDRDTGEGLWAGPVEHQAEAVRWIRERDAADGR